MSTATILVDIMLGVNHILGLVWSKSERIRDSLKGRKLVKRVFFLEYHFNQNSQHFQTHCIFY